MTYAPILRWDNGVLKPVLVETSEGLKIAFDEELCDCECGEEVAPCDCSCPDLEDIVFTVEIEGQSCTVTFSFRGGEQEQGEECWLHYLVTDPDPCELPHDISVQEIVLQCTPWVAPWEVLIDFVGPGWNHIAKITLTTACPEPGEHEVDVLDGDGQIVTTANVTIAYSVP